MEVGRKEDNDLDAQNIRIEGNRAEVFLWYFGIRLWVSTAQSRHRQTVRATKPASRSPSHLRDRVWSYPVSCLE
jgi:hypothetical protein